MSETSYHDDEPTVEPCTYCSHPTILKATIEGDRIPCCRPCWDGEDDETDTDEVVS